MPTPFFIGWGIVRQVWKKCVWWVYYQLRWNVALLLSVLDYNQQKVALIRAEWQMALDPSWSQPWNVTDMCIYFKGTFKISHDLIYGRLFKVRRDIFPNGNTKRVLSSSYPVLDEMIA